MVQPGTVVQMLVARISVHDAYLADEDCEVFLPSMEVPEGLEVGDVLEVFVFPNEKGVLEATLKRPTILLGGVKKLLVKDSTPFGAFLDIGIRADLFMPPGEQQFKVEDNRSYVVTMQYDVERVKLYGSTRISRYLNWHTRGYTKGREVEVILLEKEDNGFKVIIDQERFGYLPFTETYRQVRLGETYKAFIKKVEPKLLVVSFQTEGLEQIEDSAARVKSFLEDNSGYARLNDDSDPEEIKLRLHMSKKSFKKAIGYLQKRGQLTITRRGIKLLRNGDAGEPAENADE